MANAERDSQGRDHDPSHWLRGAKIEIPEARYKADLELFDRFVGFSGELVRLSLAGFAATGFFVGLLAKQKELRPVLREATFEWSVGIALVALAVATALALAHRFLASDGMFHHFKAIKLLILTEPLPEQSPHAASEEIRTAAARDEDRRTSKFEASENMLGYSGIFLIAGMAALGIAFLTVVLTISI